MNTIIENEVREQYLEFITVLNQTDAQKWSEFYSKKNFLSAFLSTDFYDNRQKFVDVITEYFSMRESQTIEPQSYKITAISDDLVLITSNEIAVMKLKTGGKVKAIHTFSLIWFKEENEWKIVHSHESWIDEVID